MSFYDDDIITCPRMFSARIISLFDMHMSRERRDGDTGSFCVISRTPGCPRCSEWYEDKLYFLFFFLIPPLLWTKKRGLRLFPC